MTYVCVDEVAWVWTHTFFFCLLQCIKMLQRFGATSFHGTRILPEGHIVHAPQAGVPETYPRLVDDGLEQLAEERAIMFRTAIGYELARLGGPGSAAVGRRPGTALSAVTTDTHTGIQVRFYWSLMKKPMDFITAALLGREVLESKSYEHEQGKGWLEHGRHHQAVDLAVTMWREQTALQQRVWEQKRQSLKRTRRMRKEDQLNEVSLVTRMFCLEDN